MQRVDIVIFSLFLFTSHKDLLKVAGRFTYIISRLVNVRHRLELQLTFYP